MRVEPNELDAHLLDRGIQWVVAYSGGSDDHADIVKDVISDSMLELPDHAAILTGGTPYGVPKIATEMARERGYTTIGVFPERGEEKALHDLLDFEILVRPHYGTSEYGDESEVFVKASNAMIVIGGSMGTAIEFSHAMKINDRRLDPKYKDKQETPNPIWVAPLRGVGGFSQAAYELPLNDRMREALPQEIISDGKQAGEWIECHLR
ncbi:hypothetical protein CMO91_00100 [Candidatus Woesearchaeota archaeon]|nr:hypothetical protein [Candidatus Woesearchaeota archaeon]|tara:strand:+ start:54 stop:677 length:624 start_codon:yes stop_codon:yes gene_type:complete